jgi:hypothetical protein
MKNKHFLLFVPLLLYSCSSLESAGKVLRNEKINSTDEFLVKKKEPLVLPPDYSEIPSPGSLDKKQQNVDERIKKILKSPQNNINNENKSSSVEEAILNNIRK